VSPSSARLLLMFLAAYAALGCAFAVAYASVGVARLDAAARHASWGFRLLVAPAALALWPLLARRWLEHREGPPEERNAHRLAVEEVP
jgi:hypothetical protein